MSEFEMLIRMLNARIKKYGDSPLQASELRDMMKQVLAKMKRDEWESEMYGIASELD